jgi:UDP-2-acetamido-3-amino-2,3-dideoxy-glucuronate N-acetyltransferase
MLFQRLRAFIKRYKLWQSHKSIILTKKIGKGTIIHSQVWIGRNVIIGKNVKIQAGVFLPDGVRLEDNVFIGPGVIMTNDKYPPSHGKHWQETLVKKGASIGAGAIILPGLVIGENAKVGAGAVITKSVPAGETWVGNPAKKL